MTELKPFELRTVEAHTIVATFHRLFDLRVIGERNIPRSGAAILACNHQSYLDPPLVSCVTAVLSGRVASFFAAANYLKNPVVRHVFDMVDGIAVERGTGDLGPVQQGLERLQEGRMVGLFPEGTRSEDGKIHPFRQGLGQMALRGGVPVLPVALTGAYEAWPKGAKMPRLGSRLVLRYGELIHPPKVIKEPTKEQALAFSEGIRQKVVSMAKLEGYEE